MALSVASIKGRLQAAYGPAQDTVIQGIELDKLANALFNTLTTHPICDFTVAKVGSTTGSVMVTSGTFVSTLHAAFAPAQDTGIQTTELTKLANGIENSINLDAQCLYPHLAGAVPVAAGIVPTSITPALVFNDLVDAFGSAQDNTIRDSVLTPLSVGIANGILACTVSLLVAQGDGSRPAQGTII